MQLTIERPPRDQQLARNRQRWAEVLSDRTLAELPFKIETNAHGQILMTPPASGSHSYRQSTLVLMLRERLGGQPLSECPISTIDGVRAADVGWYSDARFAEVKNQIAFERAPEICVEVVSPSNSDFEMKEKRQLYFEAGAEEVWICQLDGTLTFYTSAAPDTPAAASPRCVNFPKEVR